MDELGSFWDYQESVEHLQQKLVCTTLALEAVKTEANDELKKYKDCLNQLVGLLKVAYKERDDARNQLQKVLENLASPTGIFPGPTRANSSVTESNNSYGSPPVDSFVSSPDSTNMAIARHQSYVQDYYHGPTPLKSTATDQELDAATNIIDDLTRGLVLPQKGKLLKAVSEAGPLLNALLVSGPLPQWKNPPPTRPLKIPPLPINATNSSSIGLCQASLNMCSSASMLSFGAGSSGCHQSYDRILSSSTAGLNSYIPEGKRPRFQ